MFNRPSSRNLRARLSIGGRSGQRYGADSEYVRNVRVIVKRLPECSTQQNRVAFQSENWLVSQFRWLSDHEKNGTDPHAVRAVLQACVDEYDARLAAAAKAEPVSADTLVDLAKVEQAAGLQEDNATVVAVHTKSPGALRALVDAIGRQITELHRKAHVARVLSSKAVSR